MTDTDSSAVDGSAVDSTVETFYSRDVAYVWNRTDTEARIEGAVLRHVLADHLVPASEVVDVGGGNGRHAFDLAADGHRVRLCDVTAALVDDARERNRTTPHGLDEIVLADARDLPWPDDSADAGLMLGPMYCIPEERDRVAALRELARVVRPGGLLFVQFFSRVGGLRSVMFWAFHQADIFDWREYLRSGIFTGDGVPEFHRLFHYWHSIEQIDRETRLAGLEKLALYGMDGPAPEAQELIGDAPDELVDQWVEIALELASDPATLCCSNHLLMVARVP
jgi:ubiquinone/menaquinone biosynthesis C-methylase UbiE